MPLVKTPQYMDALIANQALPGASQNVTGLAAAHGASQARDLAGMESAGKSLGLQQRRYDIANKFAEEQMKTDARNQGINTGIAALGLGTSAYGRRKQKQYNQKHVDLVNQMAEFFKMR